MRSLLKQNSAFYEGFVLALGLVGVTLLSFEAVRRVRQRKHQLKVKQYASLPHIDGSRSLGKAARGAQPQVEGNSNHEHLESERVDPAPMSQRW
jgi:hypothetical protein